MSWIYPRTISLIREHVGPFAADLAGRRRIARLAREHRLTKENLFLWGRR